MENNEYKNKLLETFDAFDIFCKKHQIKYFAAYGTLLGAVRHQGLIPWDDDIDVFMFPEDYEKFCSLKNSVDGHYEIMDKDSEGYWLLSMAKFINTSTTLWETPEFPCLTGMYIDIFPLLRTNGENYINLKKKYDDLYFGYQKAIKKYSFKECLYRFLNWNNPLELTTILLFRKAIKNKRFSDYNVFLEKCKNQKGDYWASYDGAYGEREILLKKWVEKIITLDFEGRKIPVPECYHKVLTQLYGNYMTLPPIEKRISLHPHYFIDLNKRISIKEIKKILKRNDR